VDCDIVSRKRTDYSSRGRRIDVSAMLAWREPGAPVAPGLVARRRRGAAVLVAEIDVRNMALTFLVPTFERSDA
jgi:hypothetical protein